MLCFELHMPGVGSWDGRWSGEGNLYAKLVTCRNRDKADALLERGSWGHSWPDGWRARVTVREVDAAEARKIRRKSKGFCAYDWMVWQIMEGGEIRPGHDGCRTF